MDMNKSTKILMDTILYLTSKVLEIIEENDLQNEQDVLDFLDSLNELSVKL